MAKHRKQNCRRSRAAFIRHEAKVRKLVNKYSGEITDDLKPKHRQGVRKGQRSAGPSNSKIAYQIRLYFQSYGIEIPNHRRVSLFAKFLEALSIPIDDGSSIENTVQRLYLDPEFTILGEDSVYSYGNLAPLDLEVRKKWFEDGKDKLFAFSDRLLRTRNKELEKMGFNSYTQYLDSELWDSIRQRVVQYKGWRCCTCGAPHTEIHHYDYSPESLRGDDLTNLWPICGTCHKEVHFPQGRYVPVDIAQVTFMDKLSVYQNPLAI